MPKRDFYEVLGVPRGASADDIRTAYRNLARKFHPDVNKSSDASARFNEVQEAYDTLSDDARRKEYDRFGHVGAGRSARGQPGGVHYNWSGSGGPGGSDVDMEDLSSMFETFFGGRGGGSGMGGFGKAGAGSRARTTRRPEPAEVAHEITVDFMKAAQGGTETLRIESEGQGKTIEVSIPRGVKEGAKLRVKGAVDRRDLILTIHIATHPLFRRGDTEGGSASDLYLTLPLSIAEATLGATVTVPTLEGPVELTVPPGTGSGAKLRLRGRGIEDGGAKGDLYAVVKIVAPDGRRLSEEDRAAITRIAASGPGARAEWPV